MRMAQGPLPDVQCVLIARDEPKLARLPLCAHGVAEGHPALGARAVARYRASRARAIIAASRLAAVRAWEDRVRVRAAPCCGQC